MGPPLGFSALPTGRNGAIALEIDTKSANSSPEINLYALSKLAVARLNSHSARGPHLRTMAKQVIRSSVARGGCRALLTICVGVFLTAAAKLLGVNPSTLLNWEKGYTEPLIASLPAISQFLGRGAPPFPAPQSLPERLIALRRAKGCSIQETARRLGVDEEMWGAKWGQPAEIVERVRIAQVNTTSAFFAGLDEP